MEQGDEVVVMYPHNLESNPCGIITQLWRESARAEVKVTRPGRGFQVGGTLTTVIENIRPYTWARTLPVE
jgi:hypothetical protein